MEDYPRTLEDFEARFPDEAACREYLVTLRWPEGPVCPRCQSRQVWPTKRGLLACGACGHQASITAGTIFHGGRKPLRAWFRAIWWVTSQKTGASALSLQRVLGLGSYKTAWTWLHKLRRAMVRPGRERLRGRIEVDETYLGGSEEGVRGRQTERKALIAVACEEKAGKRIGRIRLRRIRDASAKSLHPFVCDCVEPGSVVHTDGWEGYSGLEKKGYPHQVTKLATRKESASELLPRVHRVISLLKRWLQGTHQGAVSHEHLDYYLDEFTFRFNRRTSRYRGKLFYRLLQNAVAMGPTPYRTMVKHARGRQRRNHKM
jgi:transposase-like protein